jgi:glycosyltransferase involved in cell wall biosynthesis
MLDSTLRQTYKSIDFIFVDDGSTDSTESILKSYARKFDEREIDLVYIVQEISGQAAAINVGLNDMKREYFTWLDSEGCLFITSVEKRAGLMKNARYDKQKHFLQI